MWSDLLRRLVRFSDDEDGMALVTVMLAAVVLGGLATLMLTAASFETRSTGVARDEEAAIHAADAGADVVFGRLLDEPSYTTGHTYDGAPAATNGDQRTWVLSLPLGSAATVDTGDGAGYGIGPVTIGEKTYVYGVGMTGDSADPRARRIVRTEIVRSSGGLGDTAILVGDDLEFIGGYVMVRGSVHTNANLTMMRTQGGYMVIDGSLTASGATTVKGCCLHASPEEGMPQREIPDVRARDVYDQHAAALGSAGKWYDLCTYANGGVERGQVRRGSTTPCTGEDVATLQSQYDRWRGWEYVPEIRTWRKEHPTSTAEDEGVFYAHHTNLETKSVNTKARTTYLASADWADTAPDYGARSGNLDLHGASLFHHYPAVTPWSVFADRDIHTSSGGGSRKLDGLLYCREQIEVRGALQPLNGSVIAGGFTDSPGSPENTSLFHGSAEVTYVDAYDLGTGSGVQVYSWTEL